MRLESLEYHSPESLGEAAALLTKLSPSVRVAAGGTDLLADMKLGKLRARHLISLARIPELGRIAREPDGVTIGALATANRIASSPEVRETLPALADAASVMGGNQIRNLATIGGNLASAVPSADLPPSLLVGGATLRLVSADGERHLPIADFFLGPRKTALRAGEILASVHLPLPPDGTGSAYEKFQLRDASALAVVGVAAWLVKSDREIAQVRVAVGAAAPTPRLVPEVERGLVGEHPSRPLFREAGEVVAAAISPIDDLRGSAEFRRRLAAALTERALLRACGQVPEGEVAAC